MTMMASKRDSPALSIVWLIGGFFLSIVALFSILAGYFLGLLMLVAMPFVLGVLALYAVFVTRAAPVETPEAGQPAAAAPARPAVRSVTATVVAARGTCPRGYRIELGDVWSINGGVHGPATLCPRARQLIGIISAQLKEGEVRQEEISCAGPRHQVVFAVRGQREEVLSRPRG